MILALSCKNPLGDESGGSGGAGGGGSGGGQTITNAQGKVFPAWYLTEQQQQQDFSMGPTILFQSTTTPQQHYRIPAIIVADNGNIIAIADNRYNHGGDIGAVQKLMDIVYKVSKDGGYNWSSEKIMGDKSTSFAYTEAKNKGDALVFKANDGDLVCMAVSGGGFANATVKTPSRMVRSVSTDNGETWSDWKEVGQELIQTKVKTKFGAPKIFAPAGRGLTLKDGTFVAAMSAQNTAGNTIIIYTYSKNKGQTWEYGSAIENSGNNGTINEPKVIAELDDGKLLMSVRNASGGGSQTEYTKTKNRMYAISTSTGANCTWPISLSAWDFRCGNVDAEGVVWTRNGIEDKTRIIHIQGGPNYRRGLILYVSEDQGKNFPKKFVITPDTFADKDKTAYSSLDVAGDGTIVTLAEEYSPNGQYYDIVFRRYNMKQITGEVYKTEWYKEIKTK